MKFVALFLVIFMSVIINLPDGYLVRLGIDANIMMAALAAIVIAGLTMHRRLALIVLVVLLSVGANLPESATEVIGVNRDFLLAGLIALLLVPFFARFTGIGDYHSGGLHFDTGPQKVPSVGALQRRIVLFLV